MESRAGKKDSPEVTEFGEEVLRPLSYGPEILEGEGKGQRSGLYSLV